MFSISSKQVITACFVFFVFLQQCKTPQANGEKSCVIYLENSGTTIGILPEVGGRAVFLGKDDSPNLLRSDPALWDEPDSLRPSVSVDAGWKEYNGHTTWLGPQSEWWVHQDIDTQKRNSAAVWPPDSWLIYANYDVIELTDSSVVMLSPESPVSGVQLIKHYRVNNKGEVDLKVICKNIRREPVSWDIWLNTRVDGFSSVYVPCEDINSIRIKADEAGKADTVPYMICDGYFSYLPELPVAGKSGRNSKAFISPSAPWMAAFTKGYCIVIGFDLYDPALTHPEQGMIEVYNATTTERTDALTEMEYHGPYVTLRPGETTEVTETWCILEYTGNIDGHSKFLQTLEERYPN